MLCLGATKWEARGFRLAYGGRRTPRRPEVAGEGGTTSNGVGRRAWVYAGGGGGDRDWGRRAAWRRLGLGLVSSSEEAGTGGEH